MSHSLIGLGSNLGDRTALLERALRQFLRHPALRLLRYSRWYETKPIGGPPGQPPFLNGAALLETTLEPRSLLATLREIERQMGRRRDEPWGPRSLDLDLLLYDELVVNTPELVVPHPRMAWRRFVLRPAAETAPDMLHPTTGWTIARLWDHLNTALDYVALTGTIAAGKTLLSQRLAASLPAQLIAEQIEQGQLKAFYENPASNAWAIELEFLKRRTELLAAERPEWSKPGQVAVSDFWFDQSRAFAAFWLPPEHFEQYLTRWERARQEVVKPKLIVLLEAPADQLQRRIQRRGRPGEQDLSVETLEQIHQAILTEVARPDQGPVLRLMSDDPEPPEEELLAAVQSMK